ncbi:SusC/RagA family TonB-linked outer membrane protein [Flavobacterium sp. DSR3-2]|uniref:SusC/RagA family TonB-linked outer membrane protein n=1 Tax=Flavobacterium sp. DSR3-2 TaxID=2804634 RepID=UPI003CEDF5FD
MGLDFKITKNGVLVKELIGITPKSILKSIPKKNQENRKITGVVLDESNLPIPGASVFVAGTTIATITDFDGKFTINVPANTTILSVSYVGFETKEINIENQTEIKVMLFESASQLDEVVVVGYGTQRKTDLTGAVGSIKSRDLMQRPAINVEQSLAGKIAGVNVSTNSGRPGGRTSISIRGFSSINATNDPLYMVDGIVWTDGISNLNPNDVESIDVLKDASSTAIYGIRGSNGVIIVTTKRGTKNSSQIRYDTYFSVNELPASRNLDVLNSKEWLSLEEEVYKNASKFDKAGYESGKYIDPVEKRKAYLVGNTLGNRELFTLDSNGIPQPIYDVDWSKQVFRTSYSQNHNLAFSGGNARTNYGFYLGYADDNGIIKESFQKKYNVRAVIDQQMKDWLKVGVTLSYVRKNEGGVEDSNGSYNVIRNVVEMVPFIPYKYADGTYGYGGDYAGLEKLNNPLSEVYENNILFNSNAFNGSSYANFKIFKGLEFTSTFGSNISNEINTNFSSSKLQGGTRKNTARISSNESRFWQLSNRFNYSRKFNNKHTINALLGTEKQRFNVLSWTAATTLMPDDYYSFFNLGAGATPLAPSSSTNSYQMESYFGRVNYNLKDKYLLTLTGRFDGSSRFGKNNQFAFFPSAAAAWRLSEEDFLKNNPTISNLKIRTSYGITGNSEIGSYRSLANLSTNTYIFGDTRASGSAIGRLANADLQWEKTAQYDAGLELGLFNDRVNIVADVYYKKTSDLLLDAPIPASSGYSTVTKNIGNMENKGLDLTINTSNIQRKNFSWSTSFNISFLKNKITALGANNEDITYGFKEGQILRVGQSVGSIFGYVRDGIYSTDETEQAIAYGKLPGDVKIRDFNQDGIINAKNRVIIGKGIPDFYGTFANTFTYKGFDLIIELQYSKGNDIFNNTRNSSEGRFGIANNYSTVLESWSPNNQGSELEQVRPTGYSYLMDTRKLSDGSLIRGKNISLGYTLAPSLTKKLGLSTLRVYASAQNFFLITKYFGYDPELNNYNTAFSQGITYSNYPKPKTYMYGLSISF